MFKVGDIIQKYIGDDTQEGKVVEVRSNSYMISFPNWGRFGCIFEGWNDPEECSLVDTNKWYHTITKTQMNRIIGT